MHKTRIDLTDKIRRKVANLLAVRLADAIDLGLQAKQAHWNVKGPQFIALHELFDRVAASVATHTDALAERLAALGGTPEGTAAVVAKRSSLAPYPLGITSGPEHLAALADALATFGRLAREAIDTADQAGDAVTADLFTAVTAGIDQQLWFVEAHLQSKT